MAQKVKRIRIKSSPWMHYRHYWKLIMSVSAFIVLCTVLLSVFSYIMFSRTTMGEYNRIGEIEVARMNETFNSVIEETSSLANQLLSTKGAVSTCLFSSKIDYLERFHAYRILKASLASNRYLTNISLINLTNQSYLHVNTLSDGDVDEIIQANQESGDGFLRIFTHSMATQTGQSDHLLISINPRNSSAEESRAAIILWVDVNRLLNRMLHKDDHDSAIALTNGRTVFARTNTLSEISEGELLAAVRKQADDESLPVRLSVHGNEYLTFTHPVDMIHWRLIYMYRISQIPASSLQVLLIGLIGVALFGLAVLIAFSYVRHLYQPIGALMEQLPDKYKEGTERMDEFGTLFTYYEEMTNTNTNLNTSMQDLQGFVKQSYLSQLLQSSQNEDGEDSIIQDMLAKQIQFSQYVVVLFDVWSCDENEFANRPTLPQKVVIDEIRSAVPEENILEIFMREDDRCILIAGLRETFGRTQLIQCCEGILERYAGGSRLDLCISVGSAFDGYEQIGQSFKSALKMASDSFVLGNAQVLHTCLTHASMPSDAKCQVIVQQLITQIKAASLSGIHETLEQLIALAAECSRQDAVETMQRTVRMLLGKLDKNMSAQQKERINTYMRDIGEQHYIGEVANRLGYFLYDYANAMSNKALIEQYELVEYAKRYANEHYADCNLHIDMLATELGVSPITLGNLFKYNTGVAFYKYVNDVRLKQAERLLLETDMSVIEISHSVGILNYTYFFTLFKKKHHISPKIYRENKVV